MPNAKCHIDATSLFVSKDDIEHCVDLPRVHFQEGARPDPRRGLATPPFGDGQQAGLQGQELGRQQARLHAESCLLWGECLKPGVAVQAERVQSWRQALALVLCAIPVDLQPRLGGGSSARPVAKAAAWWSPPLRARYRSARRAPPEL